MKSFALLRTNVGLTTNMKIMVDSNYGLSLNSIDSNANLSATRFKRLSITKNNYFDELFSHFYKEFPSNLAYEIKYDDDVSTMIDSYEHQWDEIYQYGARNIVDNKNYLEEYEYFAPLYINPNSLPKKFIILRVDGPGIELLSKSSFIEKVVTNFKAVKLFDLEKSSALGEWLDLNFKNNPYFPDTPLEIDFRNLEFCKWNGIDYRKGGYVSKSLFLDDILDEEKEIFELEKFVFDCWKTNEVVFPNIINFSFLFDDTPSTPEVIKKWSLNRYFGFYLDEMELHTTISPYITAFLKDDVEIQTNNILFSASHQNPFVLDFVVTRPFYIEYRGEYYQVEQFATPMGASLQAQTTSSGFVSLIEEQMVQNYQIQYRIVSDLDLSGKQAEVNKNYGTLNSSGELIDYNSQYITIEDFSSADVWLIEIDGVYHNLVSDGSIIKVNTDYSFSFTENYYVYKIAGVERTISFVVDYNTPPKKFSIYKLKFTDLKDFDDRIVDTEYSKFEYEKGTQLTQTDETKMYFRNLSTDTNPKELDDFIYNDEVVNIPLSSEYTANFETFKIENGDLSQIWRKNSVYCRWAYQNSLSANDVPYVLNNSLIFEDYNRTTNPFDPQPKRDERNLDYFYTFNSSTSSYSHHSLHIEKVEAGNIDTSLKFEIEEYLGIATYSAGTASLTYSFDYFSSLFERKAFFNSGKISRNVKKYSEFNSGDPAIPNITLFRGIEFRLYDVESVKLNSSGEIMNINVKNSNQYEDYKFSILLSENNFSTNDLEWDTISQWQMDREYATASLVVFEDILYISNAYIDTQTSQNPVVEVASKKVKSAPYNLTEWDYYNPGVNIFWSPDRALGTFGLTYSIGDYIYNNGDYYRYSNSTGPDFWNPEIAKSPAGYTASDIVHFGSDWWISLTSSNNFSPDYIKPWFESSGSTKTFKTFWEKTTQPSNTQWETIKIWSPTLNYPVLELVIHDQGIYKSNTASVAGEVPGVSQAWIKEYSLVPDTNYIYNSNDNPIIEMNNRYYICVGNFTNSTLENGINIYINKKWKNVLVNIAINDNTLPHIKGVERDLMYNELYSKLTAYNFIQSLNDLSDKYGFTDYVKYIIISEDGTINEYSYDNNIISLPHILRCETPDELQVKLDSLNYIDLGIPSQLKPIKRLKESTIKNLSQLNWYSDVPVAYSITANEFPPKVFENLHGNKNYQFDLIYRYTGYYMPLFYELQIFSKDSEYSAAGNYKFDTLLTDFGMVKERKFRKVNETGSVLKLNQLSDFKSIYPMLGEFGYDVEDFFIFRSTWDLQYHNQTVLNKPQFVQNLENPSLGEVSVSGLGQPPQSNQNYNS